MIDQNTLSIVRSVVGKHLKDPEYKAFIFGSRTLPEHREFCDVDIGILGPTALPASTLVRIQEDLSNSDLPYMTDVVDFSNVSPDFRKKALSRTIPL